MCKIQIPKFFAGLFLISILFSADALAQSSAGRQSDAHESSSLKAQPGISPEREIEARLEQRGEALRTRLFELMVRELDLQVRIEELDFRMTPYGLQRALAFEGSTRSMDELVYALRTRLESQKERVNKLLEHVTSSRERTEAQIQEVDAELERIRQRLSLP